MLVWYFLLIVLKFFLKMHYMPLIIIYCLKHAERGRGRGRERGREREREGGERIREGEGGSWREREG